MSEDLEWQYEEIDGDYDSQEELSYWEEDKELSKKKRELEKVNKTFDTNFTLEELDRLGIGISDVKKIYSLFLNNLQQLDYLDMNCKKFIDYLNAYNNLHEELSEKGKENWLFNIMEMYNSTLNLALLQDSVRDYLSAILSLLPKAIAKSKGVHRQVLEALKDNIEKYLALHKEPSYREKYKGKYYGIPKYGKKAYTEYYPYEYYEYKYPKFYYDLFEEHELTEVSKMDNYSKYLALKNRIINKTLQDIKEARKPDIIREWKPNQDLSLVEKLALDHAEKQLLFGNMMGKEYPNYVQNLESDAKSQLIKTTPRDIKLIKQAVDKINEETEELGEKKDVIQLSDYEESLSMEKFKKHLDAKYGVEKALDYLVAVGKKKAKERNI